MRLYSPASEEALRARKLLKDWCGEGFLSEAQYRRMEQEIVCDLRCTNIFLRVVLFLFTLIIAAAAAGLFFTVFLTGPSAQIMGVFLLIFAAIWYACAELVVSQARLYRYGIEEALAVCSVGFLCAGLQSLVLWDTGYPPVPHGAGFLTPAAGAVFSLWIWHRFGLSYAFLAAMIFVLLLPGHWTSSHSAEHLMVALIYAAGLASVADVRSRRRSDDVNDGYSDGYSIIEAFLWLGIYLAINLQLSSLNLPGGWWSGGPGAKTEFSGGFYWTTWVLTWCLPPAVLVRGVRQRNRLVMAAGATAAILTLITSKPYLGWPRQTWDPMLLGILLMGVALCVRRWLAFGPGGIRHGFTAERLSGKDKYRLMGGSALLGLLVRPMPQTGSADVRFGGGDSGGGGATSDF